jgi:hypothetical protein
MLSVGISKNTSWKEYLRGGDLAQAERGELIADHVSGDWVSRRVLLAAEGDHDVKARGAPRLKAVEVDAHVLASVEVDSFLDEQYSSVGDLPGK